MRNYTQSQIADLLGVNLRTIANYVKEVKTIYSTKKTLEPYINHNGQITEKGYQLIKFMIFQKNPKLEEEFENKEESESLEERYKELVLEKNNQIAEMAEKIELLNEQLVSTMEDHSNEVKLMNEHHRAQVSEVYEIVQREQSISMSLSNQLNAIREETKLLEEQKEEQSKGWISKIFNKKSKTL